MASDNAPQLNRWRLIKGLIAASWIIPSSVFAGPAAPNPKNLTAGVPTSNSVPLQWISGGGATAGFTVAYLAGSTYPASKCTNGTRISLGMVTSHVVTGLSPGTAYKFRVCARNSSGAIGNSGVTVAASTPSAPPPPPAANLLWSKTAFESAYSNFTTAAVDNVNQIVYSAGLIRTDEYKWYFEARHKADGSFVTSFGDGGHLVMDSDNGGVLLPTSIVPQVAYAMVGADSSLYVCATGCAGNSCSSSDDIHFVIAKLSPTGSVLWKRTPTNPGVGDGCSGLRLSTEGGQEYIYGYGTYRSPGAANRDMILIKLDANGNTPVAPVWNGDVIFGSSGDDNVNTANYVLTKDASALYTVYLEGTTNQHVVTKFNFDGSTAASLRFDSSIRVQPIRTGTWQGVPYLWVSDGGVNKKILRYTTDLTPAPASEDLLGCHNLDLNPYGSSLYTVYDFWIKNNGSESFMYIPGRHSFTPSPPSSSHNAVVTAFRMTATGCISENGSGAPYDIANHSSNFGPADTADGYIKMYWDAEGNLVLAGYGTNSDGTGNRRGQTVMYSGLQ